MGYEYHHQRHGTKPQPKKVEAILRLQAPKNSKTKTRLSVGYDDLPRHVATMFAHVNNNAYTIANTHGTEAAEAKRINISKGYIAFPDFNKKLKEVPECLYQ